ncbi:MAG: response regulator [Planctomycetes bacterium]|nr:response regulator [Planctomycetota bacterium]
MPQALVVDDSAASRTLLKGLLTQQGFTCLEAADGNAGLQVLREKWPIDLVLLDWHMEPMDGPEFLRQIRDDPRTVGVPVIMITAEASRQAVVDVAKLGVQGYVVKPFNKQMVTERIAALGLKG